MKLNNQVKGFLILILLLLAVIVYQQFTRPEPQGNSKILKLEAEVLSLKAKYDTLVDEYTIIEDERDSALTVLESKPEEDKNLIKLKHEEIRNDIILLTDAQSVQLLSGNLRRTRVTSND